MIAFFLAVMSVVWIVVRHPVRRTRTANHFLRMLSHLGLWLLGVKVNVVGEALPDGISNALFVGNHMSYVDVLVIARNFPACFVTSVEIKETPGLGLICQMAGCLFVERRNKQNLISEVRELTDGLKNGLNIAIFPEATSSNGEQIYRFRRPLYVSAIEAGAKIVPMCLNYRSVGGQPISRANRDNICWYGDMDFLPHLWALVGCGGIQADLHFLPPIATRAGDESTALAERTQAAVESVFQPIR